MICAPCGNAGDDATACPACGEDPLLQARWRLAEGRGQGAQGVVYRATDLRTGGRVAVKELPLGRHLVAGAEGASEREARVLRELRHPAIPVFVDAFVAHRSLWVIQELVDGESLEEEVAHHRYTEAEVLGIVDELLGVLAYLHGLSPPVVHRDIKPANVIRRPDGRLALVDFGSVRDHVNDAGPPTGTAAGTFGYMAPEQLRGEASPASDIYAVGALALRLLTRMEPASLLDWNHRLQWRGRVRVSPGTAALLGRMVEADPRRRPVGAAGLLAEVRRLREGRTPRARTIVTLLGGGAAVGLAGAAWFFVPPPPATIVLPIDPPRAAPPPGESPIDLPAAPALVEPTPDPTPGLPPPEEPPAPEPPSEPASGPNGSLVKDPATGILVPTLAEGAVVDCAHGELLGLLTVVATDAS